MGYWIRDYDTTPAPVEERANAMRPLPSRIDEELLSISLYRRRLKTMMELSDGHRTTQIQVGPTPEFSLYAMEFDVLMQDWSDRIYASLKVVENFVEGVQEEYGTR